MLLGLIIFKENQCQPIYHYLPKVTKSRQKNLKIQSATTWPQPRVTLAQRQLNWYFMSKMQNYHVSAAEKKKSAQTSVVKLVLIDEQICTQFICSGFQQNRKNLGFKSGLETSSFVSLLWAFITMTSFNSGLKLNPRLKPN